MTMTYEKTKSKPELSPQQDTGGDCPSASCWPSLEDAVASAVVAEYPVLDADSVKSVIAKATTKYAQDSKKRPGCCPDCAAEWMRPLPTNRWYCEECGVVKATDGAGKTPREIREANVPAVAPATLDSALPKDVMDG